MTLYDETIRELIKEALEEKLEEHVLDDVAENILGKDNEALMTNPQLKQKLSYFRFSTDKFVQLINELTDYDIEYFENGMVKVTRNA